VKKKLDFSKGIKGKFYVPIKKIRIPIYLDKANQEYFQNLATDKKIAVETLVNGILASDRALIDTAIGKRR